MYIVYWLNILCIIPIVGMLFAAGTCLYRRHFVPLLETFKLNKTFGVSPNSASDLSDLSDQSAKLTVQKAEYTPVGKITAAIV